MEENIFLIIVSDNESKTFTLIKKLQFSGKAIGVIFDNEPGLVVLGLVFDLELLVVLNAWRVGYTELETGSAVSIYVVF